MEMQQISADKGGEQEEAGTSQQRVEPKAGEPDTYSQLTHRSQDIYVVASQGETLLKDKSGTQSLGNVRVYRAACGVLTLLCLVFLLVVIILCVKIQNTNQACPEGQANARTDLQKSVSQPTCTVDQCWSVLSKSRTHRLGCQQCANGWLPFEDSCFYLSRHRLSWEESQRNCTASGGYLAVITSRNIQNFLADKGRVKYWIGLREQETKWTWVNNDALGVSYWADDPLEGDCGILSGGDPAEKNWMRAPCPARSYYICELQM